MSLFGAAHGKGGEGAGGAKRFPLPKICHTYPTMMKLGTVIPYPKVSMGTGVGARPSLTEKPANDNNDNFSYCS